MHRIRAAMHDDSATQGMVTRGRARPGNPWSLYYPGLSTFPSTIC
jgi:hypothetical protein